MRSIIFVMLLFGAGACEDYPSMDAMADAGARDTGPDEPDLAPIPDVGDPPAGGRPWDPCQFADCVGPLDRLGRELPPETNGRWW